VPSFTRTFRNIARCFPGAGNWQGPSTVSNTVAYVEGLFRPSICQDLLFKSDFQSAATGGLATTLTHPEPAAGNIHIPIQWSVVYDGVANIQAIAQLFRTVSAFENWGGWGSAGAAVIGTYRVGSVVGASPESILLNAFPYMRGYQLRVNFPAPAAATGVNSTLFFIEMPIELASIETWKPLGLNSVWTRALP